MHRIDGGPAPGTRVGILLAPPAIVITIDEYHSNPAPGSWVSGPRRELLSAPKFTANKY